MNSQSFLVKPLFVAFLFTYGFSSYGQEIKNLVFEGAGVRGIAYSGALTVLEERGALQHIQRVGGTSAGAITALAISIGYSPEEIEDIIASTAFEKFNDGRFFFAGGIVRLSKYFGWYRGIQFERWLAHLIKEKTGDPNITFAQLSARGFKDLYVTGTSLNEQKLIIFSRENFPHMPVKDAVRISMSIPLYFEPVFMDDDGHVYHQPNKKKGLKVMVDGGFVANFPIRLFDSTKYLGLPGENRFMVNQQTLGFRIDRDEQIENDRDGKGLAHFPINNLRQYFTAFYSITIENLNRQSLTKEDWSRTVSISDQSIVSRIKKLSAAEKNKLIEGGKVSMKSFFEQKAAAKF